MFERALAFEFTKALSLPRTYVLLAVAAIVGTAPLPLAASYYRENRLGDEPVPLSVFDAVGFATSQLTISAIFLVVLGIVIGSYEFAGGAERGSLLAVPRRHHLLLAKLVVSAALSVAFALLVVPACFLIANSAIGEPHAVALSDPGVLRSLVGAVAYLVLMTLFAVGAAFLFRSAFVAVAILFPLLLMVSTVLTNVPVDAISTASQFLPDQAGALMMRAHVPDGEVLNSLTGGLVLATWVAVAVALGQARLQRRDITI